MKRPLFWIPLVLFALIVAVGAFALYRPSDGTIHSHLINRPLPQFSLASALPGQPPLANPRFAQGRPRILNVFASWCIPCMTEAPQLMTIARSGVPIDAVAIRDRPQDVARFLGQFGNPYQAIGLDDDSRVQLALGSSGVPETFIVDGRGVIRYQHIGPIAENDVPDILAAYEAAR